MNFCLLLICFFASSLVSAAMSENSGTPEKQVSTLEAGVPINQEIENVNVYRMIIDRQLRAPFSRKRKRELEKKGVARIITEADQSERSVYVPVALGDDPLSMLCINRVCRQGVNGSCFFARPQSRTLAQRMRDAGQYPINGMMPFNSIDGIREPVAILLYNEDGNQKIYDRKRCFSTLQVQALYLLPRLLSLERTGIERLEVKELLKTLPNVIKIYMNKHVPQLLKEQNEISCRDTGVSICYGTFDEDDLEDSFFRPHTLTRADNPELQKAFERVVSVFDRLPRPGN